MIKVLEGGAYLINGMEIIPDGPEALAAVKSRTGKEADQETARQQTIAYGILKDHNKIIQKNKLMTDRIIHHRIVDHNKKWQYKK